MSKLIECPGCGSHEYTTSFDGFERLLGRCIYCRSQWIVDDTGYEYHRATGMGIRWKDGGVQVGNITNVVGGSVNIAGNSINNTIITGNYRRKW